MIPLSFRLGLGQAPVYSMGRYHASSPFGSLASTGIFSRTVSYISAAPLVGYWHILHSFCGTLSHQALSTSAGRHHTVPVPLVGMPGTRILFTTSMPGARILFISIKKKARQSAVRSRISSKLIFLYASWDSKYDTSIPFGLSHVLVSHTRRFVSLRPLTRKN